MLTTVSFVRSLACPLQGRGNNPCTESWSFNGIASCDPCVGSINCAPRDLPANGQCSCGGASPPTSPTLAPVSNPSPPTPVVIPTRSPVSTPTLTTQEPTPQDSNNDDDSTPEPTGEPTDEPTPEPTPEIVCEDSKKKFKRNGKMRTCKWLAKRKKKGKNKLVKNLCAKKAKFCLETCGMCDDDKTPAPTASPSKSPTNPFKVVRKKGYCIGNEEEEISGTVSSGAKCWRMCKKIHGFLYAELTDKTCYCTDRCGCMGDPDDSTIAIVPMGFKIPGSCN